MVKKYLLTALAVAAVAGAVFFVLSRLNVSDEARIRKMFEEIASLVAKEGSENPAVAFSVSRSLSAFCHDPCSIVVAEANFSGSYSPSEIASNAMRIRASFEEISLSFHDLDIIVTGERWAEAVFTVDLRGQHRSHGNVRDVREMRAGLTIADGKWVFTQIETVEVLRR